MQYKTLTLATTSLVALGLTVAQAAPAPMMGNLYFGTGHTWQDDNFGGESNDLDDEFWNLYGGGRVGLPYSDTTYVQFDVFGDSAYANENDDENFGTAFTLGGHINHREDGGSLGIFAATGRVSSIDEDTASFYAAGFEGQLVRSNWTLALQLGWLDSCCDRDGGRDDEFLHDAGFIKVDGVFYLSKFFRIGTGFAYVDGEQDSNPIDNVRLWEWTVFAERMIGTNTSMFVQFRHLDAENSTDDHETDSQTVNFGWRFHFNSTDLWTANVDGPNANLPNLGRWVSEGGVQID